MNDKVKDILAKLKKNNGADSVQLLGDTVGVEGIQRISTGCYSLDKAIGGGIPVGRIVEIFGPESSGKSTLCLEIIAQFQKQGKIVGYIDTEFSFDPMYAKALGVDLDSIILAQPNSGEEAFNIALDMIENGVQLLIMDSVAAIVPLAQQEGSMEDQQMGAQARLIGKGLRKITGPVAKHNATFLLTNQLRCLPKQYFVYTTNGVVSLDKLNVGQKIFNGKQYVNVNGKQYVGNINGACFITRKKDCFKVSYNHKQPVISDGFFVQKLAKDINVGDWLVSPIFNSFISEDSIVDFSNIWQKIKECKKSNTKFPQKYPTKLNEDLSFLLGCYYSDGSIVGDQVKGRRISFTQNSKQRFQLVKTVCEKLFSNDVAHYNYPNITIGSNAVVQFFETIQCNKYQKNKVVPSYIFNSNKNIIKQFIRGAFFDTQIKVLNGTILCYFTNGNTAVKDIQNLIYCFGIHSQNDYGKTGSNIVKISGNDLIKFNEQIGFAQETKQKLVDSCRIVVNARGKYDIVPREYALNIFKKFLNHGGVIKNNKYMRYVGDTRYNRLNSSRLKLIQAIKDLDYFSQELQFLIANRFYEIVKINECQFDAVDIQVEGGLFVCNKYLTHNSKIGVMFGNPQCVTLDTVVQIDNSSLQIKDLFQFVGLNVEGMEKNVFYDITDKQIKIKSYNHNTNKNESKQILSLVRKDDAKIVKLVTKNGDVILRCSQAHRVWDRESKQYVAVGSVQQGILLTDNNDNVQFFVEKTNQVQPIVDMQVQGNENYFTNGVLSHNTTPGGRALPYFCSVRISLNGGSAGEKNADGERITKVVKATVVKNKTYPPFKTAEFSIKFGTGIDKIESLVQGAIDNGIFEKSGAWIKLYGESFCQGIESLKTKLVEMDVVDDITQALNQIMLNNKTAQDVKDIVMKNIVLETKEKTTPKKSVKAKVEDSQQVISEQV